MTSPQSSSSSSPSPPSETSAPPPSGLGPVFRWLAEEPFRPFFCVGALWSIVGVCLWPLFYGGYLGYHPGVAHARLMIEGFGGAFVVGFLGTAGPRMATAPKLTPLELGFLFLLHQAAALCQLATLTAWGDRLFALLLLSLLAALVVRVVRFREDLPPPQMLLAITGILCGAVGAILLSLPGTAGAPPVHLFASLLLYQGFLLAPILGIGSFLFPRILGREFGEPANEAEARTKRIRTVGAAVLLLASFVIEAAGWRIAGWLLRAFVVGGYLLIEIQWRRTPGEAPAGTIATGVRWALLLGVAGLLSAGFFPGRGAGVEHLLYIGGFGLLMLMVASRVLFGHSGELANFNRIAWFPRLLISLGILAMATRVTTGFLPALTVSHHIYASLTWALLATLWLAWHRRRFLRRELEPER